jgi:hypothetical protein
MRADIGELEKPVCRGLPTPLARVEIDPSMLERDLVRLVLTLVEFLRRLMEAQAVRRMEAGTINDAQTEALGGTLMASREAIEALCVRLDIDPHSLNLDLGPFGRLM